MIVRGRSAYLLLFPAHTNMDTLHVFFFWRRNFIALVAMLPFLHEISDRIRQVSVT